MVFLALSLVVAHVAPCEAWGFLMSKALIGASRGTPLALDEHNDFVDAPKFLGAQWQKHFGFEQD